VERADCTQLPRSAEAARPLRAGVVRASSSSPTRRLSVRTSRLSSVIRHAIHAPNALAIGSQIQAVSSSHIVCVANW
jgi:hypothetical protein